MSQQRAMPMTDRISNLPDTILHHILSSLPTKLDAATSVLSNRWRPLWLSVPILDFDDQSYVENKETYFRFIQLVYTVMLLRDMTQPIERFSLKCVSSFCDHAIINTWVVAAIQRKVEHLSLSLPTTIDLPSSILTCKTLVFLKLRGLTVNAPSSVDFPSLKTLHLRSVHFLKCAHLFKILSKCPVLEVLKLRGLNVNAPSSVDFPSLKILHLRRVHFLERGHLFEILSKCPVLEVLLIKSLEATNFLTGCHLKSLPNLVKADVSNSSIYIPWTVFYNAEFLRTEVRYSINPYVEIPTFINITNMELIFEVYYWDWLIELLHCCPKLQVLVLDKIEEMHPFMKQNDDENWVYPECVPECLLWQLKICSFRKYGGLKGELRFARYIMQNARVLRAIKICSSSSNPQAKHEMIKKLSLCPRSSVTCELSFE